MQDNNRGSDILPFNRSAKWQLFASSFTAERSQIKDEIHNLPPEAEETEIDLAALKKGCSPS